MNENKTLKTESENLSENHIPQTDSQPINESNLPWYKKKNTIIASTSILGAGIFATVIAVPISLTNTPPTTTSDLVKNAINQLQVEGNKETRAIIWNRYMGSLNTTAKATIIEDIVRKDAFIDEFINFIADNLYISETTTDVGSITKADADLFKTTISNATNKPLFKDTALATYTKLFDFTSTTAMFTFKDKATAETIQFSLTMPLAGLDLKYNDDRTVDIQIPATHDTTTAANNVRLSITKFTTPSITSAKDVYFKANSIIKFPSSIMTNFSTFLDTTVKEEEKIRTDMKTSLGAIEKSINSDSTGTVGLSYWNSFALNYATSNVAFLKAEFGKDTTEAGIYKFLADNAKTNDSTPVAISDAELKEIKTLSASSTSGDFILTDTPFASSPSFSDLFFATNQTSATSNYALELTVNKFSYKFVIDNLFAGSKAIHITPSLEMSATLIKKTNGNNSTVTYKEYNIAKATYEVGNLINMSPVSTLDNGGFIGFFNDLLKTPQTSNAKLTNGLVTLNSKSINDQLAFWNSFASNSTNKPLILAELKKDNVLYDFITNNIEWTNVLGTTTTFPTITEATLLTNITNAIKAVDNANFSFDINSTAKIALTDVAYGSGSTDKFSSIKIYFGNEAESIS
ncbi:MAG: hypothetical protein RSE95_02825, partial [Malacoplasma sp.]